MDFDSAFSNTNNHVDDIDGFDPVPQQQGGLDDFGFTQDYESAFQLGGLATTPTQQQQQNAFFPQDQLQQSTQQQQQQSASQSNTGVSSAKKSWADKKAKQLTARKEQQQKALEQNIASGKKELADFRTKRDTHTNRLKSTNRAEEKETQTALQATLENGTEFEKVAKYCDLKPKHDKIATQPGNTERMRTLLIDLKNDKTVPEKK